MKILKGGTIIVIKPLRMTECSMRLAMKSALKIPSIALSCDLIEHVSTTTNRSCQILFLDAFLNSVRFLSITWVLHDFQGPCGHSNSCLTRHNKRYHHESITSLSNGTGMLLVSPDIVGSRVGIFHNRRQTYQKS